VPDHRHVCPHPLLPGLIGGIVGATLVDASRREAAAQLRREIDSLAAVERTRLAKERERLVLAQNESRRDETERAYHKAVLWLEHCNNDERLDYLAGRHGPELVGRVVTRLLDDIRRRPGIAALLDAAEQARRHCQHARESWRACETRLVALRCDRWTAPGVWLCGAVIGIAILWPCSVAFGMTAVAGYGVFLAALAAASPLIVRWQPTPFARRATRPGPPLPCSLRDSIACLESALIAAETELSTATIEQALAREALSQAFAALHPTLIDDAFRHTAAVREWLDALQAIYPPRVRCELAAIEDAALHARFAPGLPAALDRELARLI